MAFMLLSQIFNKMLTLICGVGRAGKTTYSQQLNGVIHFDGMGNRLSLRYSRINEIASRSKDIVIEGIYNTTEQRRKLLESYQGTYRKCIWLDTPKDVVIERMSQTQKHISKSHFDFEPPTLDEGWDEIIVIREEDNGQHITTA